MFIADQAYNVCQVKTNLHDIVSSKTSIAIGVLELYQMLPVSLKEKSVDLNFSFVVGRANCLGDGEIGFSCQRFVFTRKLEFPNQLTGNFWRVRSGPIGTDRSLIGPSPDLRHTVVKQRISN